ncbi:hypothetical protein A8950_0004 [Dongia mobilis]|uniref:Uncharacterized protein n=1 Tax=Dongia mobilis TaxID=578943 RepID=A0A4R6WW64_9PROT|nr:hypothetical protein [Dongia mobilis]TDQ86313.1 hypothetical protein A8950_0004 [Dongia mobilis]
MAGTANIMLPGAPNQPVPGGTRLGAIEGGMDRPGAINQAQFRQLLEAQRIAGEAAAAQPGMTLADYRKLAGPMPASQAAPPTPPAPLVASDGIPNLTPEQFAVLTGMAPAADAASQSPAASAASQTPAAPTVSPQLAAAGLPPDADSEADGALAIDPAGDPGAIAAAAGPIEADGRTEDGAGEATDPRVVWFDTMPDRDDRRRLEGQGKKVRLSETPGARELFLGPDGSFGWDDFIDLINPLQHIPVVAQIYRAVTGDQAYALSQFVGALPFGPISVASAVIDTTLRAQTGRDAGTDLAASILGVDNRTPEEANLHLVAPPSRDLAAMPEPQGGDQLQQAALPAGFAAWTRESAGLPGGAG